MRPRTVVVALVGLALIAGVSVVTAQKGRPRLARVPGATTLSCIDLLPRDVSPGDSVCGDPLGPYSDGVAGIVSELREGDREFRVSSLPALSPPPRHFVIRFPAVAAPALEFECAGSACAAAGRVLGQVIETTVVPSGDLYGPQDAGANTNLVTAGNVEVTGGLTAIPIGGTHATRLKLGFPDPDGLGYRWSLYFNPAAYPGTGLVSVTRSATEPCTWTISAGVGDLAGLTLFSQGKGKTIQTFEGRFSMPFTMTFTAASCS